MILAVVLIVLFSSTAVLMIPTYLRFRDEVNLAKGRLPAESKIVQTRSGPTEYSDIGEGYPVLMIHGAGGGYDQSLLLAQALVGDGFRFIAPSRFGYLRTPLPADPSPAAQADAYADLLDALNIRQVALVGFSAGGPSTLQFALRHPDRCTAMVMISAASHTATPATASQTIINNIVFNLVFGSDFIYWSVTTYFQPSLLGMFGESSEAQANATPAERDFISDFLQGMNPITLRKAGIFNDIAQLTNPQLQDYPLKQILAPTLVIHTKDDSFVPFSNGQHTAQDIPAAQLIAFQSGGHILIGDHEQVKHALREFLSEHI